MSLPRLLVLRRLTLGSCRLTTLSASFPEPTWH
jgi:hypothetical protein